MTRPKQADLKRAVSTSYYGLFHTLCELCADTLVGSASPDRTERAWVQVYRSVHHRHVGDACKRIERVVGSGFPKEVRGFAIVFPTLKALRHSADYDPTMRLTRAETLANIQGALLVADAVRNMDARQKKAFAVHMLFPKPRT